MRLFRTALSRTATLGLAPVAALLALGACGAGEGGPDRPGGDAGQSAPEATVYQGALTVIETEEHGPQLAGVLAQSYPPQGGGLDVAGWDWGAVEHDAAAGTRWGSYIVTGTFDGESFELTEEPIPTGEVDMDDYPHLEYTEPEAPAPSEDLSEAELQDIVEDLTERFPVIVNGGWPDAEHGVARIDAVLVTPQIESYVAEAYPEGAVVFSSMLRPIS